MSKTSSRKNSGEGLSIPKDRKGSSGNTFHGDFNPLRVEIKKLKSVSHKFSRDTIIGFIKINFKDHSSFLSGHSFDSIKNFLGLPGIKLV